MSSQTYLPRCFHHLRHLGVAFVACAAIIGASAQQSSWAAELSRIAFSKFAAQNCPASGSCGVDFGSVPGHAKRRYEITQVSCYLVIGNTSARPLYWYLYGTRNGELVGRIHLRPTLLGTTSTEITYHATEQGLVVVAGGGSIGIAVTRDTTTPGGINGLQCSIGGYDVRLE